MTSDPRTQSGAGGPLDPGDDETRDDEIARLFGQYIDRLSAGEKLDKAKIETEHPEVAAELLHELETFVDLGVDHEPRETMGFVDPEEILREHPRLGPTILEDLETYAQLRKEQDAHATLGTLGDYTLRRQIGRGGMGVVYEAWENSMDRRVALKVLPSGVAVDERALQRFVREARTAGQLSHANVVSVYGMGLKEQTPYYAMEFVEGETLAQVMGKLRTAAPAGPTPIGASKEELAFYSNVAKAFADVADGLQHAHSKGIIHRDIKPSNLILDRDGRLRILDFGLARMEGLESITQSGDFLGTPLYMSPEQARRKKVPLDHRTDIYSLGTTLYELIAGSPPFLGKDHSDTLSRIIERDPPEPRKLNPRVPRDLETIVLKCLRKDPADRYGTAEALGQDLRRFVRGVPIEARPQSGWERTWSRAWRNRLKIVLAMGSLALAGLAIWLLVARAQEEHSREKAAYEDKVLEATLKIELSSLSRKADAEESRIFAFRESEQLAGAGVREVLNTALRTIDEAIALTPARPDARYHRARVLLFLGRSDEALAELETLERTAHGFVPAMILESTIRAHRNEPGLAEALRRKASAMARGGWAEPWIQQYRAWRERRFEDVIAADTQLLELERKGERPFLGSSLGAYLGRGTAHLERKDPTRALMDFAVAESLAPGSIEPVLLQAKAWYQMGKLDEARDIFERLHATAGNRDETALAIAAIYASLGEEETELEWVRRVNSDFLRDRALTWVLWDMGHMEEAVEAGRRAISIRSTADLHHAVGYIATFGLGRNDEAKPHFEEAVRLEPRNAEYLCSLGMLLWFQKDLRQAIEKFRATLLLDPGHPKARARLAQILTWQGKYDEAIQEHRRACDAAPLELTTWHLESLSLFRMGRFEEALRAIDRSLAIVPRFAEAHLFRARAHEATGKFREALDEYLVAGRLPARLPAPYLLRADLLLRLGRLDEALETLTEVLDFAPKDRMTHRKLSAILEQGDWETEPGRVERLLDALEVIPDAAAGDPWVLNTESRAIAVLPDGSRNGNRSLEQAIESTLKGLEGARESPATLREMTRTLKVLLTRWEASGRGAPVRMHSLPPYRAIDSLLECEGTRGWVADAETADAKGADGLRRLYLEGRRLERSGDLDGAQGTFERLSDLEPDGREPLLALAGCLRARGAPEKAERVLRTRIEKASPVPRDVWECWAAVSLSDLKRNPEDLLSVLTTAVQREDRYAQDLRWLCERLAAREPIRINCGGKEVRCRDGRVFGEDRFFVEGEAAMLFGGDIADTDDDSLYHSARFFSGEPDRIGAYRIPLPQGSYRVRLHFAEVDMERRFPGWRVFDVALDGRTVLEELDPCAQGFAMAVVETFDTVVARGFLEISFVVCSNDPEVSAIEVERIE